MARKKGIIPIPFFFSQTLCRHSIFRRITEDFVKCVRFSIVLDISLFQEQAIRLAMVADDGEYRPTKKGITVSPAQLPELGEAIRKLIEKVAGTE